MTTYYHSAPLHLAPESIIQPGNWGRILNSYRQSHLNNAWLLAREMAFEAIRSSEFSGLPSRLSCAFVFESLEHATQYRNQFSPWNLIYEVEIVSPDAPSHRAAFNLVQFPGDQTEFLPVTVSLARKYWGGSDVEVAEILTMSPLRITNLTSSGPGSYQP